jgi:hypothetical protein
MSSAAPAPAGRPAVNPWLVAVAVVVPTFMEVRLMSPDRWFRVVVRSPVWCDRVAT